MSEIFKDGWIHVEPNAADRVRLGIASGSFADSSHFNPVRLAERIAYTAHDNVFDKSGQPYIAHPARIATALAFAGHDDVRVALGWLHDVVEDTDLTLDEVMAAFLPIALLDGDSFGNPEYVRLREALDAITARPNEPRAEYYERVRANADALAAKEFDVNDNLLPERTAALTDADRERLAEKYRKTKLILGFE